MNASLATKKSAVQYYGKTGAYLFSILSLCTLCIYVVVHILLFGNASFQLDEVAALLKMIGIEFVFTAFLILLLFLAESFDTMRSKR